MQKVKEGVVNLSYKLGGNKVRFSNLNFFKNGSKFGEFNGFGDFIINYERPNSNFITFSILSDDKNLDLKFENFDKGDIELIRMGDIPDFIQVFLGDITIVIDISFKKIGVDSEIVTEKKGISSFKLDEEKRLMRVKVKAENGKYILYYDNDIKVFYGNSEDFRKFLMRIKAKDNATSPRSVRNYTYADMVKEIESGNDPIIWVWKTKLDKLDDLIKK